MSYSTSRPPQLIAGGGMNGASIKIWYLDLGADTWESVHAATEAGQAWITNARDLGMHLDDIVHVKGAAPVDFPAVTGILHRGRAGRVTTLIVEEITAAGGAILN